jgi:hypothetical protein
VAWTGQSYTKGDCKELWLTDGLGLYTDESPGLKVDPVVVMTLSVVFIFSVVALHGMYHAAVYEPHILMSTSHRQGYAPILRIRHPLDPPILHTSTDSPSSGWRYVRASTTLLRTPTCEYPYLSFPSAWTSGHRASRNRKSTLFPIS